MTNITKKALEASLKKMMLKKPLDKITIRDITDDCGISRMTFSRPCRAKRPMIPGMRGWCRSSRQCWRTKPLS